MTETKNQRRHPRVTLGVPGRVYPQDQPGVAYPCHVIDVSLGGAFVHCTAPVGLGSQVQVEIHFDQNPLLAGKVVQNEADSKILESKEDSVVRWARGSSSTGFGIEFVHLAENKRAFLEKLIEFLATQNPPDSKPKK